MQYLENIYNITSNRNEVSQDIQPYWTFRDDLTMIDGVAVRARELYHCNYSSRH